jgi:hypothetical protein
MKQLSAQIEIQEPNLLATQQEAAAREVRFTVFVERRSRFVFRVAYALLRNSYDARTAWRIAVERLPKRRNEVLDLEMPSTDAIQSRVQSLQIGRRSFTAS